uniref:BZIP domain-containing protein n=1 Tax=Compsopogon caeruleus TaxID=31354 RepID=A0A7S1TIZ6_9RHOD|mmetsp:Transcript_9504/g.19454  ORF Transcript_9504/g.19454 Transcript_9504/m.19454 type:complete len:368 (+) Transcript_9504:171-1274(+)
MEAGVWESITAPEVKDVEMTDSVQGAAVMALARSGYGELPPGWGTIRCCPGGAMESTSESDGGGDSRRSSFTLGHRLLGSVTGSHTSAKMGLGFLVQRGGTASAGETYLESLTGRRRMGLMEADEQGHGIAGESIEEELPLHMQIDISKKHPALPSKETEETNASPTRVQDFANGVPVEERVLESPVTPGSPIDPIIPLLSSPAQSPRPSRDWASSEASIASGASDTDDVEVRKEIRRMKNRESAQKSRARRVEYIENMELRVMELKDENKHLHKRLEILRRREAVARRARGGLTTMSFNEQLLQDKLERIQRQQQTCGYRLFPESSFPLCLPLQQLVGVSRVSGAQAVELVHRLVPQFLASRTPPQ